MYQNDTSTDHKSRNHTRQRLAKEHGVSAATIQRDAQFAAAVEKLKPVLPDIETIIIGGKGPAKKTIIEAAEMVDTQPERAAEFVNSPRPQSKELVPIKGKRIDAVREAAHAMAEHFDKPINQWSPIEIRGWMRIIKDHAL